LAPSYARGSEGIKFREGIRAYNSLFAFSSMGAKVDQLIEQSRGPYVYKISGQVYHRIGSLLLEDGQPPKYAQNYVYDSFDEVEDRISALQNESQRARIDRRNVASLTNMLDRQ
jgi:hypothetical protein